MLHFNARSRYAAVRGDWADILAVCVLRSYLSARICATLCSAVQAKGLAFVAGLNLRDRISM
jgi:hypothetical protein